ncbi:hypothetical protein R75465_02217 [Paraburkholderia aspalathi]|nr:hypothetical protein R75465_02217 [Paraburkholderia aspalathi]
MAGLLVNQYGIYCVQEKKKVLGSPFCCGERIMIAPVVARNIYRYSTRGNV